MVGQNEDPMVTSETVSDVATSSQLSLTATSPLRKQGLNLTSRVYRVAPYNAGAPYSLDGSAWGGLGKRDFFDRAISHLNIGCRLIIWLKIAIINWFRSINGCRFIFLFFPSIFVVSLFLQDEAEEYLRRKKMNRIAGAAALWAGIAGTFAYGTPPLLLDLKNNSGLPNSQVYIGFIGGTLGATNVATGADAFIQRLRQPQIGTRSINCPKASIVTSFSGRNLCRIRNTLDIFKCGIRAASHGVDRSQLSQAIR